MFNIKKQMGTLYASSVMGQLSLSGAWVAILASRGFSLAQIGIAETVFHIVSILFEIPSGVMADVFGRKKMLVLSAVMRLLGNMVMICSVSFLHVCISIALHALSYNFCSGSDDALAFDSLKSAEKECLYEKYASVQLVIYRTCEGISTLFAGLALVLGYKIAYATGVASAVIQIAVLQNLVEVHFDLQDNAAKAQTAQNVCQKIACCFRQSIEFLHGAHKALFLMLLNSLAGAMDILLLFFLQAKLPRSGIPDWALGIALLFMQTGGIIGSRVILRVPRVRYRTVAAFCFLVIAFGIALEHSGFYVLMALGGFAAALADDALQVRTNFMLQNMFPSQERASLTSVESFTFSAMMIFLSPLAGIFFERW